MGYFRDHYSRIDYPIAETVNGVQKEGLRRAQLGAIHAIGSHFTLRQEPALITMPTGSGKSAVLMLSAFQQRAERVLVVAPSRMLRKQLHDDFASLATLKDCGAVPSAIKPPTVTVASDRPGDLAHWEGLRMFDVVIATPNSLSPAYEGVVAPPPDLFDLILVDEAHHSPATTWQQLLLQFPGARRILFTATPFRRDLKHVPGRVIYAYPIREAYKDQVFGKIGYQRVEETEAGADIDVARAAAKALREDQAAGLRHLLLVRTDQKIRAKVLKDIYDQHTDLRLELVLGGMKEKVLDEKLARLRAHAIDGVICVDMLGEGIDIPHFKVAAIHAPHKSLAVTLQFIGRLARTKAEGVGAARFLAVEHDIEGEIGRMYKEGALWQEMVIDLSESHVEREMRRREVLEQFESPATPLDAEIDVSLEVLRPYNHLKVYEVEGTADLTVDELDLGKDCTLVYDRINSERNARVFVTSYADHPKWCTSDGFDRARYDLFVVYYHAHSRLLFINATDKSVDRYEDIASLFVSGGLGLLPTRQVNRVLLDLEDPEFYSVGMRSVHHDDNAESYRTLNGGRVQEAIRESDAMAFHRGHVYGAAMEDEEKVTIGFSSSSKVWRNGRTTVPELLDWCDEIAAKLTSQREVRTGSNLDRLTLGEPVTSLPKDIIGVHWAGREYRKQPDIRCGIERGSILDLDLCFDRAGSTSESAAFQVIWNDRQWSFTFSLQDKPMFAEVVTPDAPRLEVELGRNYRSLVDYFNSHPLSFFTADCSRLCGKELFRFQQPESINLDLSFLLPEDWAGNDVCIETEYGAAPGGKISIHDYLERYLDNEDNQVVIYDHRSGEVADFICIGQSAETVRFTLYHCKKSSKPYAGERVEDVYEVIGQAIKSHSWLNANKRLLTQLKNRTRPGAGSRFVRGNRDVLDLLFEAARSRQSVYEIVAVQPGISRKKYTVKTARIFNAARDFLVAGNCEGLRILCSE